VIKTVLGLALAGVLGVGLAVAGPSSGDSETSPADVRQAPVGLMGFTELAKFSDFPIYGASDIDGLQLKVVRRISPSVLSEAAQTSAQLPVATVEAAARRAETQHEVIPDFVSLVFGNCDASTLPCSPAVEIQIWRSCNRSLDDYELAPGTPYPHTELEIRGTEGASFGDRIELYSGSVTIVIFADQKLALRAAESLRPLNPLAKAEASTRTDDLLPVPDRGPSCS
jgi:hypothetical protein